MGLTTRLRKPMLVLGTTILIMQAVFMPVGMVYAETTNDTEEQEQVELPAMKNYLEEEQISDPRFFFTRSRMQGKVEESLQVTFFSDQEVSEARVFLPEEATLLKDQLPTGISVEEGAQPNEWIVQSKRAQNTFVLPLVFGEAGSYELSVEEITAYVEISQQEVAIDQETVQESMQFDETSTVDEYKSDEDVNTTTNEIIENFEVETTDQRSFVSTTAGVASVVNWIGFIEAFSDPTIFTIEISGDFEVPTTPLANQTGLLNGNNTNVTGGATFVYLIRSGISRTLTINGNGYQIDFGSVSLGMNQTTHNNNSPWDITFNDLDVYSGNWWGFFQTANLTVAQHSVSNITLNNVTSYGNELIAPYYTNVNISGVVNNHITETYTSKFRTGWRVNTVESVNLETRSLTIKEDATLNLSTVNSGSLIIGLGGLEASLTLEKNATINIESDGTTTGANANGLGASIDIVNGDLVMGEGSTINLNTTRSYSAIQLRSSGSNLLMGQDAKINLNSTGHTNSSNAIHRNIVYMGAGSNLFISNGAEFIVNATSRGSASSHIIHVAGASTFRVMKDGTLDIKSDSTAPTQSLINFAAAGSTFQFADAKRVNLQRTAIMTGTTTTNGLIGMAGTSGVLDVDIQNISMWERDNVSDVTLPAFTWDAVFNLKIGYSGIVSNINTFSIIDSNQAWAFQNFFTTQNRQRVLFTQVEDVAVTINPLSENRNKENSYIITGTATPNSTIVFSGDPAIPNASVNGHIQTDQYGNYSYKLPEGNYFTGGNIVTATASLNGKSNTANTLVESIVMGTLTVNHQDEDGNSLAEPEMYEGVVGDTYTTSPISISGWQLKEIPENANGIFLESPITVTYVYKEDTKVSPVDPLAPEVEVDPENKPELPEDQGQLSIDFISSFTFGSQAISVHDQTYFAQPQRLLNEDGTVNESEERPNYVQISDRRSVDERNGWALAVTQKEQFKGKENQVLNGAMLSFSNQQVITAQGGTEPGLQSAPYILVPGNRRMLLQAQGSEGTGTWIYRFGDGDTAGESVALNVPRGANPEATTYSSTLIWELSAVPGN
ncbi:WxL domain-containing protein [Enterococcus casseliflavus]|nr:WxL domain-containing protein [Enterococcus casseliflavus]